MRQCRSPSTIPTNRKLVGFARRERLKAQPPKTGYLGAAERPSQNQFGETASEFFNTGGVTLETTPTRLLAILSTPRRVDTLY